MKNINKIKKDLGDLLCKYNIYLLCLRQKSQKILKFIIVKNVI
jgi:hypothetical protein